MKTNVEMNKKVKDTLDAAASIQEVKVSPFFKENVMHQIRNASEDVQDVTGTWFTPKLQLATLVCVVVLNILAFNNLKETSYEEGLSNFAESYGLVTSTESTILN
ncbi:hypothetical protein [Winogradskyella sediminis]|uniref:Uncharacterized protein n=1 Tax=Winogradskyella sediminis TaxID=1382466 RepID=A0A1H1N997_9FLAO|nr:hypothetical protein [Winogradskyella sediminis]REG87321.1 hypothetical protein C8N41_102156 [Winogradskyella sediminis]SDR95546.1 hypothetical protein SAMN04489797_0541 [Winogradskyella sediminis]